MPQEERAPNVFDDLAAEHAQLDAVLAALEPHQWAAPSACAGWTVTDVVIHLAQTEEFVVATASGAPSFARDDDTPLDDLVERMVDADRALTAEAVFGRWRRASAAAVASLRERPPTDRLAWAAAPLSPRTLATTRIAEHWAHAHDIAGPLGIAYPDTARLRHIAWLGHRTLPYAFAIAGEAGGPVRCELTGPDGRTWRYGDPAAPSLISGPAGEFCRVGARRLAPEDTALRADGPHAAAALRVLRNYAA
jgi:uncharacterized protein (TIGR03084 family)